MITFYLPVFDPEEFEAIKDFLYPNITNTNDEWRGLALDRAKQIAVEGDFASVAVTLHLDDFVAWETAHGRKPDFHDLDMIAASKGRRGDRD